MSARQHVCVPTTGATHSQTRYRIDFDIMFAEHKTRRNETNRFFSLAPHLVDAKKFFSPHFMRVRRVAANESGLSSLCLRCETKFSY